MKHNLIGISGKMGSGKDTVGKIIQYLNCTPKSVDSIKHMKNFILNDEHKSNLDRVSHYEIKKFAGKLKEITAILLGCTIEQLEDRDFKNKELGEEWWYYKCANQILPRFHFQGNIMDHNMAEQRYLVKPTPRMIMQLLGTEAGRGILHPNLWVNALFADYKIVDIEKRVSMGNVIDYSECFPKWIITDVRFPNEAKVIKDRGGIMIRVNRPRYCKGCTLKNLETQDCYDCVVYHDDYQTVHPSETSLDDYADFDFIIENNGSITKLVNNIKDIFL